jgi:hypothetical protein
MTPFSQCAADKARPAAYGTVSSSGLGSQPELRDAVPTPR